MNKHKQSGVNIVAKKDTTFFNIFGGQYIIIVLDKDQENTVANHEMTEVNKTPMVAVGYFLDENEDYIFLGHSADEIHQAVRKEYVVHVEIHNEDVEPMTDKEKLKEILKNPRLDDKSN